MELAEATALAGTFITRVIFKVHSLPLHETSRRAALWRDTHKSGLPIGQALVEMREHLARFSVREEVDKAKGRSLHLTISAIAVDIEPARCPALRGNLCGIYDARPLTCRTVPAHYSRPPSVLTAYLDEFVGKPDRECDVSASAPPLLEDQTILDEALSKSRSAAYELQTGDYAWKREIVAAMEDAGGAYGFPSHQLVQRNSERGVASAVPMLAAWRIARRLGVLSDRSFERVCHDQARLIAVALARGSIEADTTDLQAMLLQYEIENARTTPYLFGRAPQGRGVSLVSLHRDERG